LLQTFFSETRHIRYFLVSNSGDSGDVHDGGGGALSIAEKAFLQATLSGQNEATRAAIARANTIVAFDTHKSEVILPLLECILAAQDETWRHNAHKIRPCTVRLRRAGRLSCAR
jgi:hypothetical protein